MKPLSPVDAISPAFSRTRTILLPPGPAPELNAPFRFWFFLKIAITAALTQGNIYGAIFGIAFEVVAVALGIAGATHQRHVPLVARAGHISPIFIGAMVIALAACILIALLFAWIWCRFRFTLFDLVLYRRGLVGEAWSPYASQAWRFLGLMVLISLSLGLLFALTAGTLVLHLIALFRHLNPQQLNADPTILFAHIFPLYGILFLFALAAGLINAVAQDFILPPMALEDAPLEVSFARFFHLLRTRFWYLALYMLMRFVLEIGLGMAGGLALFIVLAILGGGAAGIGFVFYHAFWHAGPGGVALFVVFCILAALVLFAVYLLMIVALYGAIAVVKQSYALYFYGSYYPLLGDRLEPPAAVPPPSSPPLAPPNPWPPPIPPPPAAP